MAGEIHTSTIFAPKPLSEFQMLKREALKVASETNDAYIQSWTRFVIGGGEFHRGRINDARDAAHELMRVGGQLNDPRSTGLGLGLLAWISLVSDSFAEALEYSEQALAVAITPLDRATAVNGKGGALILLRRTDEGAKLLEDNNRRCVTDGDLYQFVGSAGAMGVCKVFQGNIGAGIRWLEAAIATREREGYGTVRVGTVFSSVRCIYK